VELESQIEILRIFVKYGLSINDTIDEVNGNIIKTAILWFLNDVKTNSYILFFAVLFSCGVNRTNQNVQHTSSQCIQKIQGRYIYLENCD